MKQVLRFGFIGVTFSALALAGTWSGHLMDSMCKGKDPATHTKQCAIGCAKSGFGVVTADGKFVKFDSAGNEKALAALKASDKTQDLKVQVSGTLDGDTLKVESIQLQ